jgi:hypothetical protein
MLPILPILPNCGKITHKFGRQSASIMPMKTRDLDSKWTPFGLQASIGSL